MAMPTTVTSSVDFPYGFPSAGCHRIFIQMKHGDTVETGVFDADVHQAISLQWAKRKVIISREFTGTIDAEHNSPLRTKL